MVDNLESERDPINDHGELNRFTARYEEAVDTLKSVNTRALELIRRQPVACLLGAAALGFFVARVARR